ncbi:hypothetical protein Syun_024627 [Stephania yunnanensis]|uniref:C2 domain-containing protein n=1 Tax=Stephania yunnanensis TaxID=152371 RepID=A0AAP0I4S5_9MAGN
MGNCCSDAAGGRAAVGGTAASHHDPAANDAVDHFLKSRGYNGLFTQIELSLSASNLRDMDVLSKSDPIAVVYTKGKDGKLEELSRTEVVLNSLNPVWITKLSTLKLEEQQLIGEASCTLSEIVTKPTRSLTLSLMNRKESSKANRSSHLGELTIHAEECVGSKTLTEVILRCSDLEYKDLFSRSDPFLVISKIVESGNPIPVCKTEVKKNDLNPKWNSIFLSIQQIGSEVLKSQLFVEKFSESVHRTFLDYIAGGCELNFMVAIDFTASNGNPRLPDSLHYIDPSGRPNAYQRAISEVGEVLQFYDSDKKFPAWGFGARPIDGPVSHCFNLNGSNYQPEVEGIQGIMMAYTSALYNVSLAGPTLFGPVINNAALIASQAVANNEQKYFVLLIITDGVITDLQETKDALVKASDLPLSILIVGVGGADFKEMEVLDADKGDRLENHAGRVATRDIVQFVPFRDVQSGEISIVQSLLAELPTQFLTYMRTREAHLDS